MQRAPVRSGSRCSDFQAVSAAYQLCGLEQVTQPLWASVSPPGRGNIGDHKISQQLVGHSYGCGPSGHLVLALFGCIYHHVCKWAEFTLACEAFEDLSLETSVTLVVQP